MIHNKCLNCTLYISFLLYMSKHCISTYNFNIFFNEKNVKKGGMVKIVLNRVWDIAELTLHVITWLVCVMEDVVQDGLDISVMKVKLNLITCFLCFFRRGVLLIYCNIFIIIRFFSENNWQNVEKYWRWSRKQNINCLRKLQCIKTWPQTVMDNKFQDTKTVNNCNLNKNLFKFWISSKINSK